jgi:hypothetical protein
LEHEDAENEGDVAFAGQGATHGRYLYLFRVAKQMSHKRSRVPRPYDEIIHSLRGIIESLTVSIDGEIRDADGPRRGRPRSTGDSHS